jgi:predicted transglutaminase-like cysteine proteinase
MQPFKISDAISQKFGDLSPFVSHGWLQDKLLYITSRTYRTTQDVVRLLEQYTAHPSNEEQVLALSIIEAQPINKHPAHGSYDAIMLDVLRTVKNHVLYVPDAVAWKDADYWQSPQQTIQCHSGDCEDGAILTYCLARLCGIPAHRLYVWLGEVNLPNRGATGGHACLLYVPDQYPLNVAMMDWCYDVDTKPMPYRSLFELQKTSINEWSMAKTDLWVPVQSTSSSEYYIATWGLFNERGSYASIKNTARVRG